MADPTRKQREAFDAQTDLEIAIAHARGVAFILGQATSDSTDIANPELTGFAIGALESLLEDADKAFRRMTEARRQK